MNEQLQNTLAALAEKFGTTVEHLWDVLIYQARVEAVVTGIELIFIAILFSVSLHYVRVLFKGVLKDDWDEITYAPIVCLIIGMVLLGVWAINDVSNIITMVWNPEYWALRQILHR